ncbi:M1 family aminopeptidase [Cyanobium sp. ATX-6F1]
MAWDERVYGLEYDLDQYNIVAVRHFNMGAMENKSLNIFNSKLVLADAATATDGELERIESVIAHEYFHNWTGNRITCRDWFQLSLKEGLTVFRDQCFTADLHADALKRIEDVSMLRNRQFREDAGPTAHPVQPDHYQAIDNFYTTTIYEKGSELIRMLHTLLGEAPSTAASISTSSATTAPPPPAKTSCRPWRMRPSKPPPARPPAQRSSTLPSSAAGTIRRAPRCCSWSATGTPLAAPSP